MLVVGASGVGKTSLVMHAPDPIFLMDHRETGLLDLKQIAGLVPPGVDYGDPVENWKESMDALDNFYMQGGPRYSGRKSLVVEAVTGFERMMVAHACKLDWGGDEDKYHNFAKGNDSASKKYWSNEFIDKLIRIRGQGYHVFLTCHSQTKPKDNTEGSDYAAEIPVCDKRIWQQTHPAFEAVIYYTLKPILNKEATIVKAAKANVGGVRVMYTAASPVYGGKNRWGVEKAIIANEGGKAAWNQLCNGVGLDPATAYFR